MTKPQPPPILDFSVFYGHDSQAKAQLVQRVRECCLNNGFFQITGHKVSPELQRRTFDCAKRFFDLPLIEKKKIERSKNYPWYPADKQLTLAGPDAFNRGYEAFQSHMSQPGSAPDRKEGLFLGPDLAEDHPYCVQKKLNCGPNRWPQGLDDLEEFKLVSMEYYAALFQLAKDVVAVLALTMDYEETFFDPLTEGAIATLRYLHYPPQPVGDAEAGLGTGAHRDYSCITLLLQDGTGGLQVLDEPTGQWLDVRCSLSNGNLVQCVAYSCNLQVKPVPGAYIVNLANVFARMTNGHYKSALHRVVNKSGLERYSIPFFFTGNPDYVCECLSRFRKEGEPVRHPPATVHEVVAEAVRGTVERANRYNAERQGIHAAQ
ncbi:hypothetical protein CNMCM8812_006784 [Aspergillus fumigatus]|nr:hypothetical protein CNMCM8812_006784 [Aspergillus fumigatus]